MFTESAQLNPSLFLFVETNFLFMNGKILFDSVTDKFKWFFANENPCLIKTHPISAIPL